MICRPKFPTIICEDSFQLGSYLSQGLHGAPELRLHTCAQFHELVFAPIRIIEEERSLRRHIETRKKSFVTKNSTLRRGVALNLAIAPLLFASSVVTKKHSTNSKKVQLPNYAHCRANPKFYPLVPSDWRMRDSS